MQPGSKTSKLGFIYEDDTPFVNADFDPRPHKDSHSKVTLAILLEARIASHVDHLTDNHANVNSLSLHISNIDSWFYQH